MGKQKKNWSAEQKLTIVLTVLKEQATVAEVSRQYGAAESLIHNLNHSRETVPTRSESGFHRFTPVPHGCCGKRSS